MAKKPWVYTTKRRASTKKAREVHEEIVELGKPIYYKKHGIKD
jgi:hypothetical protein